MSRAGVAAFVVIVAPGGASWAPSADRAAVRQAPPSPADTSLHLLAVAAVKLPPSDGELAWLVQQGAVFGGRRETREPEPIGFALSRRGTLALLDAAGATVALAAACAIDSPTAACRDDGDGDGCADVPEMLAAFDRFDPNDCVGGASGAPAVNCLFPAGNIACDVGAPPDACSIAARDPGCDGLAPGRD